MRYKVEALRHFRLFSYSISFAVSVAIWFSLSLSFIMKMTFACWFLLLISSCLPTVQGTEPLTVVPAIDAPPSLAPITMTPHTGSNSANSDTTTTITMPTTMYNYQCLPDVANSRQHFDIQHIGIGIQVTNRSTHQILSRIFAIFLHDVLNYRKISIVPIIAEDDINSGRYEERKLRKVLHYIKNHPLYPRIAMINLEVWMSSLGHALIPNNVQEAGVALSPGRFGWFAFKTVANFTVVHHSYDIFRNLSHPYYEQYLMDDDNLQFLQQHDDCEMFESSLCTNMKCVTLLGEYRRDGVFVENQIEEMKLYVNVIWLGPKFRRLLYDLKNFYTSKSEWNYRRFLVFHWKPSDVISSQQYYEIMMPLCEGYRSLMESYCKYELTPIIKYYHKSLANEERLMYALRLFWLDSKNLQLLMNEIMEMRLRTEQPDHQLDSLYDSIACKWLQRNAHIYNVWISKELINLSIGGIFPIKETSRGHQNLLSAVRKAVQAVNRNATILTNFNLILHESDGECKADVVLNTFIHYFSIPKVLGVLGPACSETLEPIAGISRHTNMAVVSYSAEGASFVDRQAYPFFFRTIASNRQYADVYMELMKMLGWHRVAAITEDGQKYTEYISHMEATMKTMNLEMITNKKFLSEVTANEMRKHLMDLKKKRAKIIIADVHNKYAQILLCEASKLQMTAFEGYIWFLPSWLSTEFSYNNCSKQELWKAFEGHFSIFQKPFGDNDSVMPENIKVKQWLDDYSLGVDHISNYAGFAYDAVWVYALAADRLLQENKDAVENFRMESVVKRFVDIIWETDFNGLSGRVHFGQGGSRITDIIIMQWQHNKSIEVGVYRPRVIGSGRQLHPDGGILDLNFSSIQWLSGLEIPGDGTYDCSFSTLAATLNVDCDYATFILTSIISVIIVIVISLTSFLFWKERYKHKMKHSAKIMKIFGIDLLSPSRNIANTLDKWEVPKENVVVNRRLGEGAFGTVYGGEAQIGDENWTAVAVKTLKTGASMEDRLDFLSEAEAMKRFNHKNIIKLLGVCLQSEPIYAIMEFMLYGDLKTYLLARRHLVNEKLTDDSDISPRRLTMYALDVSRGLAYLAQQKYIHRDIACRNCLVNSQRIVKLGDFGMARPTYESDYYRFHRKGMLPVRWMAPEALVLGLFTPASDVWSFGVVLFEIITFGSFPYQGLTNNQVLEHVKNGNTLQIPNGVKPHLEGLIKSCWTQDAKKRPSAAEIVEYIGKYSNLLTPCLEFPGASVEMPDNDSDQLEILPIAQNCLLSKDANSSDMLSSSLPSNATQRQQSSVDESTNLIRQSSESTDADNINDCPPITPDGYSIMTPLLMCPMTEIVIKPNLAIPNSNSPNPYKELVDQSSI